MKTSALKKKPRLAVVEAPAPADPLRAALAQAIIARDKARAEVARLEQAIHDASIAAYEIEEKTLPALAERIAKGQAADVSRAATTLSKNPAATVPMPWQGDTAIRALEMEKERLALRRSGIAKMKADLADLQDDAARAHNEVLICVKRVTLPIAQKILDETKSLKRRVSINRQVLDLFTASEHFNEQPRFSDMHSIASMRAQEQRASVLEEVKQGAEELHFSNDYDVAEEASAKWRQFLSALQTNADAMLPD